MVMKSLRWLFIFLPMTICLGLSAQTASGIMDKAAAAARAAKGITGSFTVSSSGGSFNGTLKASGNKFVFTTPSVSTWYNGKYMWTYNASSHETTLVSPTQGEIQESNPLNYLKSYNSQFIPSFSKTKVTGKYVIVLSPKSKRNAVKNVVVTLNSKSLRPEKFVVAQPSGVSTTISVKSLNYTGVVKVSEFEYPKSRYKGVQIVDLR